jgi:hypothetical protein
MADETPTPEELTKKHSKLEAELRKAQSLAAEKEKLAQDREAERDSLAAEFEQFKLNAAPKPTTPQQKKNAILQLVDELTQEFYGQSNSNPETKD